MRFLIFVALSGLFGMTSVYGQWVWLDSSGKKVYSDQGPGADVPPANILRSPVEPPVSAPMPLASGSGTGSQPKAGTPTTPGIKPSGKDSQLEIRKRQAEQEASAQRKADTEKEEKLQAENCARTRQSLALFESGVRVRQPNAKGEPEVLDDAAREKEKNRLQEVISSQCK